MPSPKSTTLAELLAKNGPVLEMPDSGERNNRMINETDMANGRRLANQHGADLRFTPERGWFVFDGRRFRPDSGGQVREHAKAAAEEILDELRLLPEKDQDRRFRWAKRSQSAERLRAMIFLAESEPGIYTNYADFDAQPLRLNCNNGTLELGTAELCEHSRDDLLTRLAPVNFDPEAKCSRWIDFLNVAMDGNSSMMSFLQRAVGYSLTGRTGEQCLFFLYGNGANGKSVFLETIQGLLGDYAMTTPTDTIMMRRQAGISNNIAALAGSRLVAVNEVEDGQRLAEARVKDLTGGDTIAARFLYKEFFEFQPQFKLWMRGNHKPQLNGTDEGIWRRICLVPFAVQVEPEDRDPNLIEKLRGERPGILNWALVGLQEWLSEGLKPPETILAATQTYREEMDLLGNFIQERCQVAPGLSQRSKELYDDYRGWAEENGFHPLSHKRFSLALTERGFEKNRQKFGQTFRGIQLQP